METISYLIKVDLLLLLFSGAYRLLLAELAQFKARRAWILIGLLCAFLIPAMPLPEVTSGMYSYTLPVQIATPGSVPGPVDLDPFAIVLALHFAVATVLLVRAALSLRSALRLSRTVGQAEAFSFIGRVSVPAGGSDLDRLAMLTHERVHVVQGHSFDILLLEVLAALNWSFPFWKSIRREIRLVHEHLADEQAQRVHPAYQDLLVASAVGIPVHELINHFHSNTLTKRIEMMNRPPSSTSSWTRMLIAVPVLLLGLAMVSWQAVPFRPVSQDTVKTAEKMPEYPGGQDAMIKYLGANLTYPEAARKARTEGTVFVSFVVSNEGKVKDAKVERGVSPELDKEALRVVSGMPDWKPGSNQGKPVTVEMKLPIRFSLPAE